MNMTAMRKDIGCENIHRLKSIFMIGDTLQLYPHGARRFGGGTASSSLDILIGDCLTGIFLWKLIIDAGDIAFRVPV